MRFAAFRGPASGPVTITSGSGEFLDKTALALLLGNHSKEVFLNIFAFTLDELHSNDLLEDDRVNSQIYSAGMGVKTLPAATKRIGDERSGLYRKRGSKHKIAKVAAEFNEIESRLKEVADNSAKFGDFTSRLELIEKERERLINQRIHFRSRLEYQHLLENGWDDWNDFIAANATLEEMENIENFPVDGLSRLEAQEERIRSAQREYEDTMEHVKDVQSMANVEIDHRAILEHSATINRLLRGRERFESAVRDLPARKTELTERERLLKETLRELGPEWDETRLEEFNLSIAVREEISRFGESLRQANRELEDRKADLARNKVALQEAKEAESAAGKVLSEAEEPSLNPDQLRLRRTTVRMAHSQLKQMDVIRDRVSVLQGQLDNLGRSSAKTSWGNKQKVIAILGTLLILGILLGGVYLAGSSSYGVALRL